VTVADGAQVIERIQEKFPQAAISTGSYRDQHWVELEGEQLVEICRWLRDDAETAFDYLIDVTAVHWPEDPQPMELVYILHSTTRNDRLRLKVRTTLHGSVPSLSEIWESANWNERETYDMFGVRFDGHPDLRRILMPEDYTDFPMLKEFPLYRV